MSIHSPVLEDASTLSRIDRAVFRFESALNLAGGLVVLMLMLLAVVQILGRKIFNAPVPGFIDWVEQFMVIFAFLGIAYCQRLGGHIRMDILIGRLSGRPLWLAELVSVILMLILMIMLFWGSWLHFLRAFDFGSPWWSRDSTIDIALPIWPAKFLVAFSFLLLSLRLVLQIWGYWRALATGETSPVAVPLIEDAATQAAAEAESVGALEKN